MKPKKLLKILDSKRCIVYRADELMYQYILQTFTTPLMESAAFGYFDLVRFLVDTVGCKVNFTDESNKSPLYKASEGGKTDVVNFLCVNNASVSQCNTYGQSPLYVACKGGHKETVNLLLQNKADLSHDEALGTCPLHVACAGGYVDIVKLLWQNITDLSQSGLLGGSFKKCLIGHKCPEKLLHKYKVNSPQLNTNYSLQIYRMSESPLYVACKGGHIDIVKLLLQYNYDVPIDKRGATPLFAACEGGHKEIVKVLLDKKADISQGDSFAVDFSKLYAACINGHTDIVKLLLQTNDNVHLFKEFELFFFIICCLSKGTY
ncbi:poly [ADP-ribose] polymerase tankyrase-2-like [Mytilus edulis]|uniref:poly [ADP-ribose] polymerase tankyrase-2-like n=1 Tax=Mytilus edulis TaxID=6550 RepID=UPI0039F10372